jgi:uncharacterized OsmC-like protein
MAAHVNSASEAYVAEVHVRRGVGPVKLVRLPGETDEVTMGSHPGIAPHIGADPGLPASASTLDYVVAATAACLAGTFARTLAARGVTLPAEDHEVVAQGLLRPRRQVLVIERILVTHWVRLAPEHHETARRVIGFYHRGCPVSQSIGAAIRIDSTLEL